MENNKSGTIFGAADILLPPWDCGDVRWKTYPVIACDQFTSEPDYWRSVQKLTDGRFSALEYILPEAYLGTPEEARRNAVIAGNMRNAAGRFCTYADSLVYLERTLPDGRIRRGIVGRVDLEKYDFSPESSSPVRATEQTVTERIPPRVAIRRAATVELPHVMLLMDDKKNCVISSIASEKSSMRKLYDMPLMLGGGRAAGWLVEGDVLSKAICAISDYEANASGGVVYAMGDGNHSLASAKAFYEELKAAGKAGDDHPARWALCEIVNLHDPALDFEPIYRAVSGIEPEKLIAALEAQVKPEDERCTVKAVFGGYEREVSIPATHCLAVGSLQNAIDTLDKNCGADCDYIHGLDSLGALSKEKNVTGFIFDGVMKEDLFAYVSRHGCLPRKTFSMGEARSKRYYMEARKIVL